MECADEGAYALAAETAQVGRSHAPGRTNPRTLETVRRTRQRLRTDQWYGAWGEFSSRVHDRLGLDLDFEDEDGPLANWRRHQRRTAEEQREFQQWQQRLNIASRQGARHIFGAAAPPRVSERAPTTPQAQEESRAWGALERAQGTPSGSGSRKRKSRSITASPAEQSEQAKEPERKLKRPRTRRVPDVSESSSSSVAASRRQERRHSGSPTLRPIVDESTGEPTFLSALLREVEMSSSTAGSPSTIPERPLMNGASTAASPSSRRSSLSPSSPSSRYSTPRPRAHAPPRSLSITPPLRHTSRPGSPLTSSPITAQHAHAIEIKGRDLPVSPSICQPQPTKPIRLPQQSEEDLKVITEAKHGINKIVKSALSPHWQAAKITKEQYSEINREVSRKLYDLIPEPSLSDEEEKHTWQKVATAEVATAVRALTS